MCNFLSYRNYCNVKLLAIVDRKTENKYMAYTKMEKHNLPSWLAFLHGFQ